MSKIYRVTAHQSDEAESTIEFKEFEVIRETPKYFIINSGRKVSKDARNAFAFADKKAALLNFQQRQKRYRSILRRRVEVSEMLKKASNTMLETDNLVNTKVNQYSWDGW